MQVSLILVLALGVAQQAASGSIEGTVLRTGTTDPIERVEVTLLPASGEPLNTMTGKEGHFSFLRLAPGDYAIRVQRDGYLQPTGNGLPQQSLAVFQGSADGSGHVSVSTGSLGMVHVDADQVIRLTYDMTPGGTISGRILDPNGRPSVGATVTAFRLAYEEGRPTLFAAKAASSNDRGEYRMFWLEPGDYFVRAEKTLAGGPARAYYPGTDNAAAGVKVRVTEGMESPKIDISIRNVDSVKISGSLTSIVASMQNPSVSSPTTADQVLDREEVLRTKVLQTDRGQNAPQFYLSPIDPEGIFDQPVNLQNRITSSQDRAAGKFELANVHPGEYDLFALITDRSSPSPRTYLGRTRIEVGVQDLEGVNLVIVPGTDLRGRIVYAGTSPLAGSSAFHVQLQPRGLPPGFPFGSALSATPDPDGAFTISNVPDLEYSVSVTPLAGNAYIADIRQGGFSIFDVGAITVGGRQGGDIEIVLDSRGAIIEGKVQATPRQLAAGITVTLIPDGRRRENVSLYKRANVSESGVFSLTGVAPGTYRLFAWESVPAGAEFNAEFVDAFREDATEITVSAGGTTPVELRLISR